ncbi:hypothetical protein PDESU_01449 [Pontiella desulfatans]|uniref:CARDB domain-containing protein n=1 Tax=Pontiella desulfatans TaxID=2750659 RepID=A0A6C2TZ65_PONDE|nr:hypothetical protein [Pontiella desulfatans]VGO12895.1 hypothetical protein PDESU_01449 [Pontiella desulfatans]
MMKRLMFTVCICLVSVKASATNPRVSNVHANQRVGTQLVDIFYDLSDDSNDVSEVAVTIMDTGSNILASSFSGYIGDGISNGINHKVVWNAGADWPDQYSTSIEVEVKAYQRFCGDCPPDGDIRAAAWEVAGGGIKNYYRAAPGSTNFFSDEVTFSFRGEDEVLCMVPYDLHISGLRKQPHDGWSNWYYAGYGDWAVADYEYTFFSRHLDCLFRDSRHPDLNPIDKFWGGSTEVGGRTRFSYTLDSVWDREAFLHGSVYVLPMKDNVEGGDSEILVQEHAGSIDNIKLNTTAGDKPVISVWGTFFNKFKPGTFLADFQLQDVVTVDVDWNGFGAGVIVFEKADGTELQRSSSNTYQIDLGAFGVGRSLYVRAVAADGTQSDRVRCAFRIIYMPVLFDSYGIGGVEMFSVELDRKNGVVTYTLTVPLEWGVAKKEVKLPKKTVKDKKLSLDVGMAMSGSISSDGTFALTLSKTKDAKWKPLGNDTTLTLEGELGGRLGGDYAVGDNDEWKVWGAARLYLESEYTSPPAYLGVLPIYVRLKVEGKAGAEAMIGWEDELIWELAIPAEVAISLIGGLGFADVASYEVILGGRLRMRLQVNQDPAFGYLSLGWFVKTKTTFLFYTRTRTRVDETYDLLGDSADADYGLIELSTMADISQALHEPSMAGFEIMPRDYLYKAQQLPATVDANDLENHVVVPSVFPESNPALAEAGDGLRLVWLMDDPVRSSENRLVLVEQTRPATGGVWSATTPVWDDGTLDAEPEIAGGGAFLVLAWQNSAMGFPVDIAIEDVLPHQEIAVAVWDGASWSSTNLTDNTVMDRTPNAAAGSNGTAMVTWVRGTDEDLVGSSNAPNTVLYSMYNGSEWSEPASVATNLPMMLWSDLAFDGNRGLWVCCLDLDDNQDTENDQELFGASWNGTAWSELVQLTSNEVQDINPQTVYDDTGQVFISWLQDEKFMLAESADLAGAVVCGSDPASGSASAYKLVSGNGNLGIVWELMDADGEQEPHIVYYDPIHNQWGDPVVLLENTSQVERAFNGLFAENGTLVLAYNRDSYSLGTNDAPQVDQTDLCVLDYGIESDVAFSASAIVSSPPVEVGDYITLQSWVVNHGCSGVSNVLVRFYVGDPTNGALQDISIGFLPGGGRQCVSLEWLTSPDFEWNEVLAVIDPDGVCPDANRANNETRWTLPGAVLEIDFLEATPLGDGWHQIDAVVTNRGLETATGTFELAFQLHPASGGTNLLETVGSSGVAPGGSVAFSNRWFGAGALGAPSELLYAVLSGDQGQILDEVFVQFDNPLDSDFDQITDAEEVRAGTDPYSSDTDGDGLDDYVELLVVGSDALSTDTDSDGATDLNEYIAGTGLMDSSTYFRVEGVDVTNSNGFYRFGFSVDTVTGRVYDIEYCDSLNVPTWNTLTTNRTGINGLIHFSDSADTSNRCYRARVRMD